VRQVGGDGLERQGEFIALVAVASVCVGADPLTGMHLKGDGPCADHFPSLASLVAWSADRIESALGRRQFRSAQQRQYACCLACGIDIKDDVAATLSIPHATEGFWGPPFGKAVVLEEPAKGL
jgi:hypothetical protein